MGYNRALRSGKFVHPMVVWQLVFVVNVSEEVQFQWYGGVKMKGRLWWSVVLSATALTCLTVATPSVVSAQSGPTITGTGPQGSFSYSPRSSPTLRPALITPLCRLVVCPPPATAASPRH